MLVAKLGKFLAFAISMKVCISLVGNRMKWKVPQRPPNLDTSKKQTIVQDQFRSKLIAKDFVITVIFNKWVILQFLLTHQSIKSKSEFI